MPIPPDPGVAIVANTNTPAQTAVGKFVRDKEPGRGLFNITVAEVLFEVQDPLVKTAL